MLSVCLINPRFEPSYWGYNFAMPLLPGNKRCWIATGALPALAALAPAHCTVELVDENVEAIDFADLARFDVIGVTGMIVQFTRMREILLALLARRDRGELHATIVVGGPYVSVAEDAFAGLCDVRFIGEAEETWPAFLDGLGADEPVRERYQQADRTDMTRVPPPRYDLMQARHYGMASLQFSRGCPFRCEFCDIITVFGRRPRLKTTAQMIVEFDAIHAAGFRSCFLVDDNFIGNKAAARTLLLALIEWQSAHGYPLNLAIEASVNLADEPELISLMARANIRSVFVGIESPRAASLAETKKIQNIRGDSLAAKVQRIRDGGLVVVAGFIVGFDSDDEAIFADQFDFIQRTGITHASVGILAPIPTTPLYDRLLAEGRLDFSDPDVIFRPKQMSREALKQGHAALVRRLYDAGPYFERLFAGYGSSPAFRKRRAEIDRLCGLPGSRLARARNVMGAIAGAFRLARALRAAGQLRRFGRAYLRAWFVLNRPLGREAMSFGSFVNLCIMHWHFFNVAMAPPRNHFGMVQPAGERVTALAS